jgi:hypothetical protein
MDSLENVQASPRAMSDTRSSRNGGSPGHGTRPSRSGVVTSIQDGTSQPFR